MDNQVHLIEDTDYYTSRAVGRLCAGFIPITWKGRLWYIFDNPESLNIVPQYEWSELTEEEYDVCIPIKDDPVGILINRVDKMEQRLTELIEIIAHLR